MSDLTLGAHEVRYSHVDADDRTQTCIVSVDAEGMVTCTAEVIDVLLREAGYSPEV